MEDTIKAFNNVSDYIRDLNLEDARAIRENLDQETLAIFDLLRNGKTLTPVQIKQVKKVAVDTLALLKAEKLRIERWRESRQIKAQVKTIIFNTLQWLPQEVYSDEEVNEKTINIYQHLFTNYLGGPHDAYSRISA
ncbi:MAG: hypothetical protein IH597_00300 [Bacteroidales bacterium]|nr:hypothetical protein [Bacteroidales bacterium]